MHQRRAPVAVTGVDRTPGFDEALDDFTRLQTNILRRTDQRRATVMVLGVDVRTGVEQKLNHC